MELLYLYKSFSHHILIFFNKREDNYKKIFYNCSVTIDVKQKYRKKVIQVV